LDFSRPPASICLVVGSWNLAAPLARRKVILSFVGMVAERRLPGEPEDATEREDIELWVDVYTELCETLSRMLPRLDPVPVEVMRHLASLQERQRFWESRRAGLDARRSTAGVETT
jgi:FAD/FMN-containing dehydrogenase